MTITWRLYSCDDHLDLWNLPRDLWEGRLPARLRERGPRVVEQGGNAWWTCDCSDREWEPFWDAAEETGLPVSFHIGRGTSQVRVAPRSWELAAFSAVGPMQLDEPLAMMTYSGVLERHPKLRLVLAESGIGWLPYFVHRMDAAADKHVPKAQDYRLRARPSELFRRQVYATFEEEPLGPELLPLLGPDNFMWASDYPHPDSTFPHSRESIAHAFRGLERAFVEQVTATNCARLYGFA